MYKLKYYYKNGDVKLSDKVNKIENFNTEIQMLTKNKNFNIENNFKENLKNLLETIMKEYEKNFNDIYRIDIIDNETNKIIDYVDRSECLVDGKKGHLIYDAITGDVIDAVVKQTFEDCVYRFKYYFCDGKTKTSSIATSKPEELYNDFDGLMDWDEYYDLGKKNLSTHDVLKLAGKVYKGFIPKFYKIEIINDKTKEVIDYIEVKEAK